MDDSKPHLLIVDDEPHNRDLLRRLLRSGYEVSEAADVNEALAILGGPESESISLILCDHLMPGRTGCELAEIVRQEHAEKVFVLITGYDTDSEVIRVKAEGIVADVLTKPWRSKELRALVASLTESSN